MERFGGRTLLVDEQLPYMTLIPVLASAGFKAERVPVHTVPHPRRGTTTQGDPDIIIAKKSAEDGSIVLTANRRDVDPRPGTPQSFTGFTYRDATVICVLGSLSQKQNAHKLALQLIQLDQGERRIQRGDRLFLHEDGLLRDAWQEYDYWPSGVVKPST